MNFELPKSVFNNQEEEQKMLREIIDFARTHDITGDEINMAYLISFEILPEKPVREVVYSLGKLIDEKIKTGLSSTKMKEVIESAFNYEDAPKNFTALVKNLHITEVEKALLISIVDKKRVGELEIRDSDSDEVIVNIQVPQNTVHASQEHLALEMIDAFENIKTKSIKITFVS